MEEIKLNGQLGFSEALALLLKGAKVARRTWNAPNQYVTRIHAMFQGYPMQQCLGLKNAKNEMQPGWVPSQGDLFAQDWYNIEEAIYDEKQ